MANEGRIRKEDLVSKDALSAYDQLGKEAQKSLKLIQAELLQTAKDFKTLSKASSGISSQKDVIDASKKRIEIEEKAINLLTKKQKVIEQVTVAEKEQERLERSLVSGKAKINAATESTNRKVIEQRQELSRLNKEIKEELILTGRVGDAFDKLRTKRNIAARNVQNLVSAQSDSVKVTKEQTKALQDAQKEFNDLDSRVKKAKESVNQFQENVGNYPKNIGGAIKSLRSFAGAVGIAGGIALGGQLLKSIVSVRKEIEKTTFTAKTLFGDATKDDIKNIVSESRSLAAVFDKDVNDVLKSANALTKQFGIDGVESLDLIREGIEKGADVNGDFLDNLSEYSTQFRLAGLSAEQSIAIITQQVKEGVFTDKGIDAIKEATISLRELTPATKEAIEGVGLSAEQIQKDIASGAKTYFEVIQEVVGATNKFGEDSKEAGKILADVFRGAGEDAGKFIFQLDKVETNLDNIKDNTSDVTKESNRLTEGWTNFVTSVVSGDGKISQVFTKIIGFIADAVEGLRLINLGEEGREGELIGNLTSTAQKNELEDLNKLVKLSGKTIEEEAKQNNIYSLERLENLTNEKKANEELIKSLGNFDRGNLSSSAISKREDEIEALEESNLKLERRIASVNGALITQNKILEKAKKQEPLVVEDSEETNKGNGNKGTKTKDKSIDDAFNLAKQTIEIEKNKQQEIFENEQNSLAERTAALAEYRNKSIELDDLVTQNAIDKAGNRTKEIERLEAESNENRRQLQNELSESQDDIIRDEIARVQSSVDEKLQAETKLYDEQKLALLESEEFRGKTKKEQDLELEQLELDHQKKLATIRINSLQGLLTNPLLNGDERIAIEERILAAKIKLNELGLTHFEETEKTKAEKAAETAETIKEIEDTLGQEIFGLVNVGFDNKIQKYDDEIQANNDKYAAILDQENLTEEQRSQLEAEREAKNAQIEKKKRKEQRKQAIFNKATALADIGINTAVGVAKAVGQTGIFGIAASIPIIALGALQAATVLATPIPKFKKGKPKSNNYEGVALLNDGGKTEYKEDAKGNISAIQGVNTLQHVKKDDVIHKDLDALLTSLRIGVSDTSIYDKAFSTSTRRGFEQRFTTPTPKENVKQDLKEYTKALKQSKRTKINIINNNSIGEDLDFLFRLNNTL